MTGSHDSDWAELARIRDAPVLLVSPHMDDAWLSCTAILVRPAPIHVLTVFGGAPDDPISAEWDAACGFSDSREANAARSAEERQAFRGTPHRLELMDLLEHQYLTAPREPAEGERLALLARDWLRSHPPGVILAPVGAGGRNGPLSATLGRARRRPRIAPHPDHLMVRNALARAVPPRSLLLYEEFPYRRAGRGDREAARIAKIRGEFMAKVDVPIDVRRKATAAAHYPSQLRGLCGTGPQFSDPRTLEPTERYWLPTP